MSNGIFKFVQINMKHPLYLGLISDPLFVLKFHDGTHDPNGQEIRIYTNVYKLA